MCLLRNMIALVLIALLAGGPGMGLAGVAGQTADCAMASMDHHPSGADPGAALAAICKVQCQLLADLPAPGPAPATARVAWLHQAAELATLTTRSIPPESPPPRG